MKKIYLSLIVLLTLSVMTGCGCTKKDTEEEITDNTVVASDGINEEQEIKGIKFKNITLNVKSGITEYRVTLENVSNVTKNIQGLTIYFKDVNGYTVLTKEYYDFENLDKGKSQSIAMTFDKDLSNVETIEYKLDF